MFLPFGAFHDQALHGYAQTQRKQNPSNPLEKVLIMLPRTCVVLWSSADRIFDASGVKRTEKCTSNMMKTKEMAFLDWKGKKQALNPLSLNWKRMVQTSRLCYLHCPPCSFVWDSTDSPSSYTDAAEVKLAIIHSGFMSATSFWRVSFPFRAPFKWFLILFKNTERDSPFPFHLILTATCDSSSKVQQLACNTLKSYNCSAAAKISNGRW